jgi:two-component system response regulator
MNETGICPDVLLIEDNMVDANLMRTIFEKHIPSERIQVVQDGAEALDFFHSTGKYRGCFPMDNLKLIIVDLQLPLVDGLYVLRQMIADPRIRMIPIVVVASSHEYRNIYSTYKLGINSYIVKPLSSDSFIGKIRDVARYWLSINEPPTDKL